TVRRHRKHRRRARHSPVAQHYAGGSFINKEVGSRVSRRDHSDDKLPVRRSQKRTRENFGWSRERRRWERRRRSRQRRNINRQKLLSSRKIGVKDGECPLRNPGNHAGPQHAHQYPPVVTHFDTLWNRWKNHRLSHAVL